jgi:hypothetical protein
MAFPYSTACMLPIKCVWKGGPILALLKSANNFKHFLPQKRGKHIAKNLHKYIFNRNEAILIRVSLSFITRFGIMQSS